MFTQLLFVVFFSFSFFTIRVCTGGTVLEGRYPHVAQLTVLVYAFVLDVRMFTLLATFVYAWPGTSPPLFFTLVLLFLTFCSVTKTVTRASHSRNLN